MVDFAWAAHGGIGGSYMHEAMFGNDWWGQEQVSHAANFAWAKVNGVLESIYIPSFIPEGLEQTIHEADLVDRTPPAKLFYTDMYIDASASPFVLLLFVSEIVRGRAKGNNLIGIMKTMLETYPK